MNVYITYIIFFKLQFGLKNGRIFGIRLFGQITIRPIPNMYIYIFIYFLPHFSVFIKAPGHCLKSVLGTVFCVSALRHFTLYA